MRLTRINHLGLTFDIEPIDNKPNECTVTLRDTGKTYFIPCSVSDFSQRWYNWQMKGDKIQYAFDNLTPEIREFLLSGITPEEWDRIFPDESEELKESESGNENTLDEWYRKYVGDYEKYIKEFPKNDPRD